MEGEAIPLLTAALYSVVHVLVSGPYFPRQIVLFYILTEFYLINSSLFYIHDVARRVHSDLWLMSRFMFVRGSCLSFLFAVNVKNTTVTEDNVKQDKCEEAWGGCFVCNFRKQPCMSVSIIYNLKQRLVRQNSIKNQA